MIEDNRILFWSARREDLDKLSREAVVEKFLNYANISYIKIQNLATGNRKVKISNVE